MKRMNAAVVMVPALGTPTLTADAFAQGNGTGADRGEGRYGQYHHEQR